MDIEKKKITSDSCKQDLFENMVSHFLIFVILTRSWIDTERMMPSKFSFESKIFLPHEETQNMPDFWISNKKIRAYYQIGFSDLNFCGCVLGEKVLISNIQLDVWSGSN